VSINIRLEIREFINSGDVLKIPDRCGGVYLLYTKDMELLYVGRSVNLKSRLYSHVKGKTHTKDFFTLIAKIGIIKEQSIPDQEIYEAYAIKTLNPIFNKAKVGGTTAKFKTKDEIVSSVEEVGKLVEIIKRKIISNNDSLNVHTVKEHVANMGYDVSLFKEGSFLQKLKNDGVILIRDTLYVEDRLFSYLSGLIHYKLLRSETGKVRKSEAINNKFSTSIYKERKFLKFLSQKGISVGATSVMWNNINPKEMAEITYNIFKAYGCKSFDVRELEKVVISKNKLPIKLSNYTYRRELLSKGLGVFEHKVSAISV
jgi:hypothetical protein